MTSGISDVTTRPHIHVTDNAIMNSLLFSAAWSTNVGHVIFFSCSIIYADNDFPVREEDFDPNHPLKEKYFGAGWTKIYIEKLAQFYSSLGKTKFTIVRHSNVFGPHDKFDLQRSHMLGATITVSCRKRIRKNCRLGGREEKRT